MPAKNLRVLVIIPAYNEASVISDVIHDVRSLKIRGIKLDIAVINDGSTDDTSNAARRAGAIVIDHILNSGAGGATSTGLRYAQLHNYDIAATMDADGQHAAKDIVAGIKNLRDSGDDLLIGSRLMDSEGMSRTKLFGNKSLSFITFLLFGIRVTDSQSGMRIFSRSAIEKLHWKTTGYEFCSEMLWRASQLKLTISEYPIKAIYTDYSVAKGQNNWNAFNILKSLIKQRLVEMFE